MDSITKNRDMYFAYPFRVRFARTRFSEANRLEVLFINEEDADAAEALLVGELNNTLDRLWDAGQEDLVKRICSTNLVVEDSIVNPDFRGKRPEKRTKDNLCAWERVQGF